MRNEWELGEANRDVTVHCESANDGGIPKIGIRWPEGAMIFIDFPTYIRPGESVVAIQGWYAGESPCNSLELRIGSQAVPLLPTNRPDVEESYPTSHCTGFRGTLDFLNLPLEAERFNADGVRAVAMELRMNESIGFPFEIPVDEDWFQELTRQKVARQKGIFPNGLPDPNPGKEALGLGLAPGEDHYRAYVGLSEHYDLSAAGAFFLLAALGLRQHHTLLDIGCGSLRCGRLLIPYLNAGHYLGIEPNAWLVERGLEAELGLGIVGAKAPRFIFSDQPRVLDGAGPIDYALANSIFSHASQSQIADWLDGVSRALSAGGALVATFVLGREDYQGAEWVYPGCVQYRLETMQRLAHVAGLVLNILDWRHLHAQTWAVFAKPKFDPRKLAVSASVWNALAERAIDPSR